MPETSNPIEERNQVAIRAEQAVLGSCLIERDAIGPVSRLLEPDDFFLAMHRRIYTVLRDCFRERVPPDILIVADRLEDIEEQAYLAELAGAVPTAVHAEHYAGIVKREAQRRTTINAGKRYLSMAASGAAMDDLAAAARDLAAGTVTGDRTSEPESMKTIVGRVYDDLFKATNPPVPTGYYDLDTMLLGGLRAGQLVVIGGRTGMGKTAAACGITQHVGCRQSLPVLFISFEMTREQIGSRLVGITGGLNMFKLGLQLRAGQIETEDRARLDRAINVVEEAPITVFPPRTSQLDPMLAAVREYHAADPLGLLVVDYLQLIDAPKSKQDNRVQELSRVSRALKLLALDLHIPVLALAQLNRAVEQREGHQPRLSDLRDSGSIEQDSDIVILLHRPEPEKVCEMAFIVAKHRDGPTGIVPMRWEPETTRFLPSTRGEVV